MLGKEAPCPEVAASFSLRGDRGQGTGNRSGKSIDTVNGLQKKICKKPELRLGNVSVLEVFLSGMGQVNVSSAGTIIGINYQAIKILMEAHGIRNTRIFWDKFRILEKEWLAKM